MKGSLLGEIKRLYEKPWNEEYGKSTTPGDHGGEEIGRRGK